MNPLKHFRGKGTSLFLCILRNLKLHKLRLYPIKYLEPYSHLNWFEIKTQTIKLT